MELFEAGTSETASQFGEIARRLDISSNTVVRYIRSDVSEPAYLVRRSSTSLDDFTARLCAWLSAEANKSWKQRRTLKQVFLDLREQGAEGAYGQVASFKQAMEGELSGEGKICEHIDTSPVIFAGHVVSA